MKKEEVTIRVNKDECWLLYNLIGVRIRQLEEDRNAGEGKLDELIDDYKKLMSRIPRYAERNYEEGDELAELM